MAGAPRFKVYNQFDQYVAACKHGEDAAAVVAVYGEGATIRDGHSKKDVVWFEGKEECPAGESYATVATTILGRVEKRRADADERRRARYGL